ncbi:hypothetical protein TRAPUB_11522 [Trametes pubescens]|uniref:Uncharacterized protein n=1 Tax=Trametes pubescens TaxID=154538 RepID=A0A1M2VWL2_TRAPU|nr:hypothetical protein TRAPUB_11522 [Trametes pubescens]
MCPRGADFGKRARTADHQWHVRREARARATSLRGILLGFTRTKVWLAFSLRGFDFGRRRRHSSPMSSAPSPKLSPTGATRGARCGRNTPIPSGGMSRNWGPARGSGSCGGI